MSLIKQYQFLSDNNASTPSIYQYIFINNKKILHKNFIKDNEAPKVFYVSLYPTFLEAKLGYENYVTKKIEHKGPSCAGVLFDKNYTIESYLNEFTKRQFRKNLRSAIKKLESSFNITYEYNFGNISQEKCTFLLKNLYIMTTERFKKLNKSSLFMKSWEDKTKDLDQLINKKEASLFVIYDNDKPISISLNRHENNSVLFSEIHSYNMDYSKYSLGHLDNYMLIKWCIENSYDYLDLGMGNLDYKKKCCNALYNWEYHIYYAKNSFAAVSIAYFEILKIKIKNFIKSILLLFKININE